MNTKTSTDNSCQNEPIEPAPTVGQNNPVKLKDNWCSLENTYRKDDQNPEYRQARRYLQAHLEEKPAVSEKKKSFFYGCLITYCALSLMQNGVVVMHDAYNTLSSVPQTIERNSRVFFSPDASTLTAPVQRALSTLTLSAPISQLTGLIDPSSNTASLYWTIDLKNNSNMEREAQFELKLPRGASVSRATLWINGKPQEAAFNTTGKVQAAYEYIVVRHRDPLLVTWKDAQTIIVKAAPVPANGTPMRIRLGLTAPLACDDRGIPVLTFPGLENANFSMPESSLVHIESTKPLSAEGKVGRVVRGGFNSYVFKAHSQGQELSRLKLQSLAPEEANTFAVRATHAPKGTYIVATATGDSEGEAMVLKRVTTLPDIPVLKDEDAAHRVSTLWAAQEVQRLVGEGRMAEAEELASTFRIVSPVSGAVVLETENDYQTQGLHREQYRQTTYSGDLSQNNLQVGSMPTLQGATNGTLAPQGLSLGIGSIASPSYPQIQGAGSVSALSNWFTASARDAALFDSPEPQIPLPFFSQAPSGGYIPPSSDSNTIEGVNTAGTVRVNNLVSLESLLSSGSALFDGGCLLASLYFLFAAGKKLLGKQKGALKDLAIGLSLIAASAVWLIVAPILLVKALINRAHAWLIPKEPRPLKSFDAAS
ncbi:MAG TPA: VIT domain-containing protein [Candidatus Obscuribacter sp.]|nr:VIT domain-containing protein [Candidatus Obscuribacter sp.]